MKKIIALVLTFVFLMLLSGCKNEALNNVNPPYKETDIEITLKSADEIYDTYGSITYTCDLSAYPMDNFCHWDGRIVLVEEDRLLVSPGGKQAKIEFGEVVWLIWDGAFAYSVGQYVDYSFQNVIAPENEGEPLNIIATTVCIP
ncbi:MAG: hypothetical protein IKK01_07030 [Clostridia bacterium]|nr:hypothetical protein [Clostridia bacterium]